MQVLELGWRPEIPEHLPEGYKSFVRQCWEEDREKVGVLLAASLASCVNLQLCSQIVGAYQAMMRRVPSFSVWPLKQPGL